LTFVNQEKYLRENPGTKSYGAMLRQKKQKWFNQRLKCLKRALGTKQWVENNDEFFNLNWYEAPH